MKGLIRASLGNPHAVIVFSLTVLVLGGLTLRRIPIDILPVFKSPAVQVLTFYGGMPAEGIEKDITNRMERWVGQANGMKRQESRSIIGASIVRNYFQDGVDPNGALTEVNSLALAVLPNLPPGTLPPVVLPFDPTSTVPVCLVALDSQHETESILYDVGRYEVRNMIMSNPGASAPVVFGGKLRAVMLYLDRIAMQARGLSPLDIMRSVDQSNVFLPSGDVRINGLDLALLSNSMFEQVGGARGMGGIPLAARQGNAEYLDDVASPKDAAFIQTNVVRVNGRRQVYIPVYRQLGASTLAVVDGLKASLPKMQARLSRPDIALKMVMDQSVYVRSSVLSLVQEGALGAVLCSLVILLFLAEWRMTIIAILTLPLAVAAAIVCLYYSGNTINVMTLAGLALAVGPMVDSAIICLENTHRHLCAGAEPKEAAFLGASEVAMPELVATLCTFLVLSPLALMSGMGQFLFRPMTLAVAFAMLSAYLLSRTLVPCFSSLFLRRHGGDEGVAAGAPRQSVRGGWLPGAVTGWLRAIDRGIELYRRALNAVLQHRLPTIGLGFGLLALVLGLLGPRLRRDFFPEVDAGAFEMLVRLPTGAEIDRTEKRIEQVERHLRHEIADDLELLVSELGVTPDWSAAYTPNAGTMDAVIKVQLSSERKHSAQEHVRQLRRGFLSDQRFEDLELAFDAGGMVRGALNEGKSSPLTVRITCNQQGVAEQIARQIKRKVSQIEGLVDARVLERLDAPALRVDVDRAKAADLGLTQQDVMQNVIASTNSSITFNKMNFWIDPVSHNQYFVGVQYPETAISSIDDLLDIPITGRAQHRQVTLGELARVVPTQIAAELTHVDIQPAVELTMAVEGRDLGHVAADVARLLDQFGRRDAGGWLPYSLGSAGPEKPLVPGAEIVLGGEYSRMQEAFKNLFVGLVLSSLLIYFLMVALARSFVVPLAVMLVVPLSLVGVLPMLYVTGSALNVQSLLGIIFIVGIAVSNTVLMTDWAQQLRKAEGLSPLEAIRQAAGVRVRPVMMTAMAAFCAMLPTALALERGSEANAPLARAILGGLLAAEPATLFVLPAIYSLLVRDAASPAAVRD